MSSACPLCWTRSKPRSTWRLAPPGIRRHRDRDGARAVGLSTYGTCGPRLVGLMWGAEDLAASLGSTANRAGGRYTSPFMQARDLCLAAAAAAGVLPIDTVYTEIDDLDGLRPRRTPPAATASRPRR